MSSKLIICRTREYNRSGENVRNCGSASVDCFYFVLTIDMPSVQFLGCWGVILWKYDVVRGYPVLGGNGDECDDESRQMIVPAHQGNYYLLNLHVSPSPAHIAVWKHGAACGAWGPWLAPGLGKFLSIEVC